MFSLSMFNFFIIDRIGAVVGVVLSKVLFSIISSSADAVIICFAGSPDVLEKNHPLKSQELRSAWREAWPGTVGFILNTSNLNVTAESPNSFCNSSGSHHLFGTHRQKLDEIFV